MVRRILFSNIGYAKGIDGSLEQHVRLFGRHFYAPLLHQQQVLGQLKSIISREDPDICCFVEVDSGSLHSANYNQLEALLDEKYPVHDVAGKYGDDSWLSRAIFHKGKSNAFVSKTKLDFERRYFTHGTKRLIYHLKLPGQVDLFFAHFSLERKVRVRQFAEMQALVKACKGEVIILADFNIMYGFSELAPLLKDTGLCVLNKENEYTFMFHKHELTLDLCLCSPRLAERAQLRVIDQPFSDHDALLLDI